MSCLPTACCQTRAQRRVPLATGRCFGTSTTVCRILNSSTKKTWYVLELKITKHYIAVLKHAYSPTPRLFWYANVSTQHLHPTSPQMDCLTDIQIATRKFCHRQYTWFRGDNMFTWVNTAAVTAEVAQTIVSRCAEPFHTGGSGTQEVAWLTKEEQKALKGYLTKLTLMHRDDAVERVLDFVRQHLPADVDPLEGDVEMRRDRGRNAQVNKMEQGSTASRVT